uniref:Mur ligase C-terminal domain-containing protein n=1 Tax=Desulfobacca acetoxidans TaxID=60893 RepID=A0A7V4G9Z6_9BACT
MCSSDLALLVMYGNYRHEVAEGALEAGMASTRLVPVATHRDAARTLRGFLQPGDWLLVKGSRSMHMEAVIELLSAGGQGTGAASP